MPKIKEFLDRSVHIEDRFETPEIYLLNSILEEYGARVCYMADYYLPKPERVFAADCGCAFELRLLEPPEFSELYLPQWSNALCEKRKQLDVLAVGAYDGTKLVGLAGCSADCEKMWQIGVDVLRDYRRRGIASAVTNRLAREALEREKVPFYCAAWSNVKSRRNAIGSGFAPAWAEVTAKPIDFIEKMNLRAENAEK